ncbi:MULTISPECIES: carbohydrate ABC transporter permease [unclassified Allobranchiibius]|uniref:carbohydrate ABC transporter permease n=1 Tax=unclassified Allobranchiibius TaxID=2649857 RepID=UPI001AA0C456|nr:MULTISPECIES: carbohydrate ABC transporter permease [unclassified Allobranchiibius]MBO1767901.1 carbohydrate ABC transporter permease [Allobranchiibius sp. GilTou38]UIJ36204.1 carbohydrate ABC transporter permease [Allobranchiibius sp. GilTou73]
MSGRTKWGLAGVSVPIMLWTLIPIVWIVATSLKSTAALADQQQNVFGNFWPKSISWDNYSLIFTGGAKDLFVPALWHSVVVCVVATFISVILATFCAYAIARLDFPGKKAILVVSLTVSFFPVIAMVTPLFNLWRILHLFDTLPGLIIPYITLTLPLSIWILSAFFQQIPWEMEQAAQVDGASSWQAFVKVVAPLAAPGVFTTAIIAFFTAWNDFVFSSNLTAARAQTVPAALNSFTGASQFTQPTGAICAAAVIVTIPVVILVLLFQRRIVAGLTSGAVKG